MAANTVSDWTIKTVNGQKVATCTVLVDTANQVAWTKKTPKGIDTSKKYTLMISASAAQDGQATPFVICCGTSDQFALSGTSSLTVDGGFNYKQIIDDLGYGSATTKAWIIDPKLAVADVVALASVASGLKVNVPATPYHAYCLNGGSTLLAHTLTFTIVQ